MPYKDKEKQCEYFKQRRLNNLIEFRKQGREYREKHKDKINEKQRQRRFDNGIISMSENKTCPLFLGVHVAEKMLSYLFKNVERMPLNNKGYDFKCANNYLVDIKSGCSQVNSYGTRHWLFTINYNIIADYFLCLAFDNRNDLNPLYLWLIPGNVLSHLNGLTISETTLYKWSQYEKPIDKAVSCCNQMKNSD